MRTFTGFDAATQTYAYQQYEQTRLKRTSASTYEMTFPDGGKRVFAQSDGSIGTSRKIFLTQQIDQAGNALSFTYDTSLRLVAITDAIGQVTTISYQHPTDILKVTKVTDPFGRFATFDMKRGIMREFRAKIDGLMNALPPAHQQAAQQLVPHPQQNDD